MPPGARESFQALSQGYSGPQRTLKDYALHDEGVVNANDIYVIDTLLLELVVLFNIAWNLARAGTGERARDANLLIDCSAGRRSEQRRPNIQRHSFH